MSKFVKINSVKSTFIIIFIFLFLLTISCKYGSYQTESSMDNESKRIEDEGEFKGTSDSSIIANLPVPGQAIDVDISGNYAYLTSDLGIFYVIDISDKNNPVIKGKCKTTESSNIVIVKGEYAYISYTNFTYEDNDFYTRCGFYIVNVSDKSNPGLIGNYDTGENNRKSVSGLFIEGNYAYIETSLEEQDNLSYIEIVDISEKENPEILNKYEIDGIATNIWVENDIGFINANFYEYGEDSFADESRLIVIDLKDKNNPEVIDYCMVNSNSCSIYLIDNYACISSWKWDKNYENYTDSMFQIVDIENLDDLKILGECEVPGGAWEMDFGGGFIYVSGLSGGIYAINLEDKTSPFIVDSLKTGGTSYDITINGNYGYIADGFEGLNIVELLGNYEASDRDKEKIDSDDNYDVNTPPVAFIEVFGDSFKEDYFQIRNPVYFSAGKTFDPDGDELNYIWKIDGNKYSDDEEFRYYFNEPGEYEIELNVSDGLENSGITETITVAEINRPVLVSNGHNFKVEIEYNLINKSETVLSEIECFMRIPQTYYPYQIINSYYTNYTITEELFDNDWNLLIHFEFDEEKLGKDEKITASSVIDLTAYEFNYIDVGASSSQTGLYYDEDDEDYKKYTSDDLFIDSDNPEIKNTTEELIKNETKPLKIAEILYNFVIRELHYDFPRAEDRNYEFLYASEILERCKGVCADYAILYTALLRSAGIPSRLSAGIPVYSILYEKGKEIDLSHAWVEIRLPGYGWIPIDITPEENFMNPNYYLNITTEKGPGYLYGKKTMDWSSYYYEGFSYSWDGIDDIPLTEQEFKFKVDSLELEDIELD